MLLHEFGKFHNFFWLVLEAVLGSEKLLRRIYPVFVDSLLTCQTVVVSTLPQDDVGALGTGDSREELIAVINEYNLGVFLNLLLIQDT